MVLQNAIRHTQKYTKKVVFNICNKKFKNNKHRGLLAVPTIKSNQPIPDRKWIWNTLKTYFTWYRLLGSYTKLICISALLIYLNKFQFVFMAQIITNELMTLLLSGYLLVSILILIPTPQPLLIRVINGTYNLILSGLLPLLLKVILYPTIILNKSLNYFIDINWSYEKEIVATTKISFNDAVIIENKPILEGLVQPILSNISPQSLDVKATWLSSLGDFTSDPKFLLICGMCVIGYKLYTNQSATINPPEVSRVVTALQINELTATNQRTVAALASVAWHTNEHFTLNNQQIVELRGIIGAMWSAIASQSQGLPNPVMPGILTAFERVDARLTVLNSTSILHRRTITQLIGHLR